MLPVQCYDQQTQHWISFLQESRKTKSLWTNRKNGLGRRTSLYMTNDRMYVE